jgi:hypothetical protein
MVKRRIQVKIEVQSYYSEGLAGGGGPCAGMPRRGTDSVIQVMPVIEVTSLPGWQCVRVSSTVGRVCQEAAVSE